MAPSIFYYGAKGPWLALWLFCPTTDTAPCTPETSRYIVAVEKTEFSETCREWASAHYEPFVSSIEDYSVTLACRKD